MVTTGSAEAAFDLAPMTQSFGKIITSMRSGESLLQLGSHAEALRGMLASSGALLFRGFRFDVAEQEAFSLHFTERFLTHPSTFQGGGREIITPVTATVDGGVMPFPWHRELGYGPFPPDIVMFSCERSARDSGETWITDGARIAEGLSEQSREYLESGRVRYRYNRWRHSWPVALDGAVTDEEANSALERLAARLAPNEALAWEFVERGLMIYFTTPVLSLSRWSPRPVFCNHIIFQVRRHCVITMDDGTPLREDVVSEVERLADEAAYGIRWEPGDLVVIDNSRVMHSRAEVTDPERRILARVCKAGF